MRLRRRLLLFTFMPLVLVVGVLFWLVYREVSRTQRDQAFIAAARHGDAAAVTRLLAQGADINAPERSGQSHSFRHLVQEWLLHRGHKVSTGPTALMAALEGLAEHRLRHTRIDPTDYPGVVSILLDHGANPNVTDFRTLTPLLVAARIGQVELVRALLDHGANVNAQDFSHGTALEYATWSDSLESVRLLLERGADIHHKDDGGNDALGGASDQDNLAMIRLLLDHGADPGATSTAGTGALSLLVRHGDTTGVKLLLGRGADPKATDSMGRTCLFWLRGKPHSEIVALLRQAGATR